MVRKNKIIEKNDNEIKKLSEAIKSLNNNNIFKIYNSTKKILFISFLKGLASGLGWIIGATILVSILTFALSQIQFIPILLGLSIGIPIYFFGDWEYGLITGAFPITFLNSSIVRMSFGSLSTH